MAIDPFAEPDDNERTILRPRPAGTGAGSPAPQAAPPRSVSGAQTIPKVGINKLAAAASPILAATIRVASGRGQAPDPEKLRAAMIRAVRAFEPEALATELDSRSLRAARYALCATVDDVVLSTPWGSSSSWVQQSLTSTFQNEVIGGERFFDIMEQMQQDFGRHQPVVELMYLCTSLGFEGRYRVMPRGVAALAELRDGVYRTIRNRRGEWERELSPHWRGLNAGLRSLGNRIPLWAIALGTLAIALAMFVWFTFMLAGMSDAAFDELAAIPPKAPMATRHVPVDVPRPVAQAGTPAPQTSPPPPTPDRTPVVERLHQFLAPEIRAGLVTVLEDAQSVTVRLANRNMFASGQATLGASYLPLLARIGEALQDEPGQIVVKGYTDDQKIRTARFPSNFELSQARADAVGDVLKSKLSDPKRVTTKGLGEANPLAPNTTADGRQQNRRTEIELIRPSNQP